MLEAESQAEGLSRAGKNPDEVCPPLTPEHCTSTPPTLRPLSDPLQKAGQGLAFPFC